MAFDEALLSALRNVRPIYDAESDADENTNERAYAKEDVDAIERGTAHSVDSGDAGPSPSDSDEDEEGPDSHSDEEEGSLTEPVNAQPPWPGKMPMAFDESVR